MTMLELMYIHVSGPGIAVLNDLPSLEILRLSSASLTDNDLDRLDACNQLRRLDLDGSPISDAAITRFVKSHPRLKDVGCARHGRHARMRSEASAGIRHCPIRKHHQQQSLSRS